MRPGMEIIDCIKRRKNSKNKGIIALIALLSAFVPLSTDLYLPALPAMTRYFHVTRTEINITLVTFFMFYGAGSLIWGPLSDRFGRKPILVLGMTVYTLASVCCCAASNINMLIVFRILQATGGSVAGTIATAIVKDVFSGRKRVSVLAFVQSMRMISPISGPVIGALLLDFTSWRGIFAALAVIGVIVIFGSVILKETMAVRQKGPDLKTMSRLGDVLENPGFLILLVIFSLLPLSGMAFVSSSSFIYQAGFGLSSRVYSYYYAFIAICITLGPFVYIRLSKYFGYETIINLNFVLIISSGILICFYGSISPVLFTIALIPCSIGESCMGPPSTNLMLEQQKENTGSASSLIGAGFTIMSSLGMFIVSLHWRNLLMVTGLLYIIIGSLCGFLWLIIRHKPFVKPFKDSHMEKTDTVKKIANNFQRLKDK